MVDEQDPQQQALDELAKALVGSGFRAALRADPKTAAGQLALADRLPEGLLQTLGVMSDQELKTVAIVQQQLNQEFRTSSVSILF